MRISILILLFTLTCTKEANASVFYWKWQLEQNQIRISGKLDNKKEVIVYAETALAKTQFLLLSNIVSLKKQMAFQQYSKTVDTLSAQLVKPFSYDISQCTSIIVELDSTILYFAIEFLKIGTEPLALFRPLEFHIKGNKLSQNTPNLSLSKGFILRDETADPENACQSIFEKYPNSVFKNLQDIKPKNLTSIPQLDFILMSVHGKITDETLKGYILLKNNNTVSPSFFQVNNPKLVFIDACLQGINWSYISALAKTKETNFYIGPVINNDAGDSSTKTINFFFNHLNLSHDPTLALLQTRQQLYDYYREKTTKLNAINKSLIFRVYRV